MSTQDSPSSTRFVVVVGVVVVGVVVVVLVEVVVEGSICAFRSSSVVPSGL